MDNGEGKLFWDTFCSTVLPYDSTQCLVYMSHAINISWIKDEGIDKYKAHSYIFIVQLHLLAGSAQQQSSFLKNSSSEELWVPFIHSCHLLITSPSCYWTSLSSFFWPLLSSCSNAPNFSFWLYTILISILPSWLDMLMYLCAMTSFGLMILDLSSLDFLPLR